MSAGFWKIVSSMWMQTEADIADEEKDTMVEETIGRMCGHKSNVKGILEALDEDDEEDDDL